LKIEDLFGDEGLDSMNIAKNSGVNTVIKIASPICISLTSNVRLNRNFDW
jgi:hypothetical protein